MVVEVKGGVAWEGMVWQGWAGKGGLPTRAKCGVVRSYRQDRSAVYVVSGVLESPKAVKERPTA